MVDTDANKPNQQSETFANHPHLSDDQKDLNSFSRNTTSGNQRDINVADWERFASVALGGGLVLSVLLRPRLWKFATLLPLAGSLLSRGATGHCALYERFGINSSRLNVQDLKSKAVDVVDQVTEKALNRDSHMH